MDHYQAVFKRYEQKYLLSGEQFQAFLDQAGGYMREDQFAQSTVCSVYYDTPDMRLIRTSLDKPVYKEKLRLRSYGTPQAGDPIFVELKKKYRGVVYKRRMELSLEHAEAYLDGHYRPEDGQIKREVDAFLAFYRELIPAMYISYDRMAYCDARDERIRITFDRNLRFRANDLSLASGVKGVPLLDGDKVLLELKTPGAIPLELSRLLSRLRLFPTSFSKYGRAYMSLVHPKKFEERSAQFCLTSFSAVS